MVTPGGESEPSRPLRRELVELLKRVYDAEFRTDAGKLNAGITIALLFVALVLTASPVLDWVAKVFDGNYESGVPIRDLLITITIGLLTCVIVVAILEAVLEAVRGNRPK